MSFIDDSAMFEKKSAVAVPLNSVSSRKPQSCRRHDCLALTYCRFEVSKVRPAVQFAVARDENLWGPLRAYNFGSPSKFWSAIVNERHCRGKIVTLSTCFRSGTVEDFFVFSRVGAQGNPNSGVLTRDVEAAIFKSLSPLALPLPPLDDVVFA